MYEIWIFWVLSLFISTTAISLFIKKSKKSDAVTAIYIVYIAISQILAVKIVNFGLFEAPAAVLIFPFTFQLTDVMNEHFGQKETHRMILIAFVTQVLMMIFLYFGTSLEPVGYWWIDEATWDTIFNQGIEITIASWISYLICENLDAILYSRIKAKTKGKYLWMRSILTDIPMLALDSVIFVTLAFGLFQGNWAMVPTLILGQLMMKWLFGTIDTPFLYLDRYITKGIQIDLSEQKVRELTSETQKDQ
jgi:uncharacterized integral membrane protein (TIGR00697 family)